MTLTVFSVFLYTAVLIWNRCLKLGLRLPVGGRLVRWAVSAALFSVAFFAAAEYLLFTHPTTWVESVVMTCIAWIHLMSAVIGSCLVLAGGKEIDVGIHFHCPNRSSESE